MLETGLRHTSSVVVSDANTAIAMGSGDMAVLATPALVALMENAAMLAVADHLPEGSTTVGGKIDITHLAPSAVGATVEAMAVLEKADGRKLHFSLIARDGDTIVGEGSHTRFIVDRERFMAKVRG